MSPSSTLPASSIAASKESRGNCQVAINPNMATDRETGISTARWKKIVSSVAPCLWLLLIILIALRPMQGLGEDSLMLVGAGSTVPLPLYKSWTGEYNKLKRAGVMQYQPMGTTEGLKLVAGTNKGLGQSDFASGEVLLSEKQRSDDNLVELPIVIIAIVPIYNVPGVSQELKFSGELLAQIYMGQVNTWNAPQIAKLNPEASLPDLPISVIYRPAGKGTNYVFTDFISKISPEFRSQIGRTASPKWPVGVPAERSSDMADKVRSTPGAIGYVELQYATNGKIPSGTVQNAAGKFAKASTQTINAACQAMEAPQWNKFAISLTNAPGAEAYPITSFTWIYVRKTSSDARRRAAMVDLLSWIYSSGQMIAAREGYSELPAQLLKNLKAKVEELK